MNLDPARRERLRAALEAAPAPDGACADAERIWEAVAGRLPKEEARALADHALGCPDCAPAWRLARALLDEERDAAPASITSPGAARPFRRWGAAALAVAGVVAVVGLVARERGPRPAEVRGEATPAVRSLSGEVLPRARFVLRWSEPVPGARYRVTVATRDLTVLHTASGLAEAWLQVPEAALAGLPAGAEVLWTVEAVLPGGRRIDSPAFAARVE